MHRQRYEGVGCSHYVCPDSCPYASTGPMPMGYGRVVIRLHFQAHRLPAIESVAVPRRAARARPCRPCVRPDARVDYQRYQAQRARQRDWQAAA